MVFIFLIGVAAAVQPFPSPAATSLAAASLAFPGSFPGFGQAAGQTAPGHNTGMAKESQAAKPAGPLVVRYADKSESWTPATLAPLAHITLTVYNEHAKANQTYTGVRLIDLLTRLGVPDNPHGNQFRLYLVAEGSDGYQVVYSVAEVNPGVSAKDVIVADTLDGKPLTDTGPLQLVATGEKRPARWVRNLVAVRVLTAQ